VHGYKPYRSSPAIVGVIGGYDGHFADRIYQSGIVARLLHRRTTTPPASCAPTTTLGSGSLDKMTFTDLQAPTGMWRPAISGKPPTVTAPGLGTRDQFHAASIRTLPIASTVLPPDTSVISITSSASVPDAGCERRWRNPESDLERSGSSQFRGTIPSPHIPGWVSTSRSTRLLFLLRKGPHRTRLAALSLTVFEHIYSALGVWESTNPKILRSLQALRKNIHLFTSPRVMNPAAGCRRLARILFRHEKIVLVVISITDPRRQN